jgi:DNA polymerase-3 subunit delta'
MRFADIPGHEQRKKLLTDAVRQGKLAHALLFHGTDGSLTLPLALALATYLHCEKRSDTDACGLCPACSKSLKYIHPDTHFVFPFSNVEGDKDEERLRAELLKSWRSFLTEQPFGGLDEWINSFGGEDKTAIISRESGREIIRALSLKPFESPNKVMIIWLPETMHPSAANSILKILEEPPAHTYFFLVTEAADRLLPTVVSRTQSVSVPLLPDETVARYAVEAMHLDKSKAAPIVRQAEGSLRRALQLVDQPEEDLAQEFADWMRSCYKGEYTRLLSLSEDFHNHDRMRQRNTISNGLDVLRECLLAVSGAGKLQRAAGAEATFIGDFSKILDVVRLEKAYRLFNDAGYFLDRNGSAKMIHLNLSIQMGRVLRG